MATISQGIVNGGIGLPEVWKWRYVGRSGWSSRPPGPSTKICYDDNEWDLDLSDEVTRQGLLRQLAMWVGDAGDADAYFLLQDGGGWNLYHMSYWNSSSRLKSIPIAFWPDGSLAMHKSNVVVPGLAPVQSHIGAIYEIVTWIGLGCLGPDKR